MNWKVQKVNVYIKLGTVDTMYRAVRILEHPCLWFGQANTYDQDDDEHLVVCSFNGHPFTVDQQ